MNERQAYQTLRSKLLQLHPTARISRVENGVEDGTPDVNYCINGKEGWIELKSPSIPKRADTGLFTSQHGLTLGQVNWIRAQHRAGGRVFVYVATPRSRLLLGAALVHAYGTGINQLTFEDLRGLARWSSDSKVQGWSGLARILCKDNYLNINSAR